MYAHLLPLLCTPCRLIKVTTFKQALLTEQANIVKLLDFLASPQLNGFLALQTSLMAGQVDYPKGHQKGEEGAEDYGEDH